MLSLGATGRSLRSIEASWPTDRGLQATSTAYPTLDSRSGCDVRADGGWGGDGMTPSEFSGWALSLNPGCRVAVDCGRGNYRVATVKAIQKRHIIVTFGSNPHGHKFRRDDGRQAGERTSWNWCNLVELTEEILHAIRRQRNLSTLRHQNWETLPGEMVERVVAILRETQTLANNEGDEE